MSKYATHNWYTLAFDADAIANVIPEDYEHRNGSVWESSSPSHAIEWMREYNEHGRTLFRVNVSVEAVDIEGVSPPQPGPIKPWHEYHGNDKVHVPNSEAVSVEVGLPKGYTAEERAKMIELRVIDDVRSVYGREAADFVTECFHQHEEALDAEKMPGRAKEEPQWWRWVFNPDTGDEDWVVAIQDYGTAEFRYLENGISVVRVYGTTADRDKKRDDILKAMQKAGKN